MYDKRGNEGEGIGVGLQKPAYSKEQRKQFYEAAIKKIRLLKNSKEYQALSEKRYGPSDTLNNLIESLIKPFNSNFKCTLFKKSETPNSKKIANKALDQTEKALKDNCKMAFSEPMYLS